MGLNTWVWLGNKEGQEEAKAVALKNALELAGVRVLDPSDLPLWANLTEKVMSHPESLADVSRAAGTDTPSWLVGKAKAVALWGLLLVALYNFIIRDLIILLMGIQNSPPPAISVDLLMKIVPAMFGLGA